MRAGFLLSTYMPGAMGVVPEMHGMNKMYGCTACAHGVRLFEGPYDVRAVLMRRDGDDKPD